MQALQLQPLNEGETYIGAIGNKAGEVYHVILLPGDNNDSDWQAAMDWAKSIGGDLPTRVEQAQMFATAKDEFKKDWYWSNETCSWNTAYAWYQYFAYGTQSLGRKSYGDCRARAVRRLPI